MKKDWYKMGIRDFQGDLDRFVEPGLLLRPNEAELDGGDIVWQLDPDRNCWNFYLADQAERADAFNHFIKLKTAPNDEILASARKYGILHYLPFHELKPWFDVCFSGSRTPDFPRKGRLAADRWRIYSGSLNKLLDDAVSLSKGELKDRDREWLFSRASQLMIVGGVSFLVYARGANVTPRLLMYYGNGLVGFLALQAALAITRATGLFSCSGCGYPYLRGSDRRRPKKTTDNYCEECVGNRIPQKRAKARFLAKQKT